MGFYKEVRTEMKKVTSPSRKRSPGDDAGGHHHRVLFAFYFWL